MIHGSHQKPDKATNKATATNKAKATNKATDRNKTFEQALISCSFILFNNIELGLNANNQWLPFSHGCCIFRPGNAHSKCWLK